MIRIIRNTFPTDPRAAHAEPGDIAQWQTGRGDMILVRISDGKTLFGTPPVDREGNLRSTGKPLVMVGVIAEVKSKGYIFEVEQIRTEASQ